MHLKMSSPKWPQFCLDLNVLTRAFYFRLQFHDWQTGLAFWRTSSDCKIQLYTSGLNSSHRDWPLHIGIGLYTSGLTSTYRDWPLHTGIDIYISGLAFTHRDWPLHIEIDLYTPGLTPAHRDWPLHIGSGEEKNASPLCRNSGCSCQLCGHFNTTLQNIWHIINLRYILYHVWITISCTTRTLHTRMPRVGLVYCFQLQRHWRDLHPDVGAMSFGPFCTRNGQVHVCSFFGETFGPVFSVAADQSLWPCWRPRDHF